MIGLPSVVQAEALRSRACRPASAQVRRGRASRMKGDWCQLFEVGTIVAMDV